MSLINEGRQGLSQALSASSASTRLANEQAAQKSRLKIQNENENRKAVGQGVGMLANYAINSPAVGSALGLSAPTDMLAANTAPGVLSSGSSGALGKEGATALNSMLTPEAVGLSTVAPTAAATAGAGAGAATAGEGATLGSAMSTALGTAEVAEAATAVVGTISSGAMALMALL
jgi:hypothetical protein